MPHSRKTDAASAKATKVTTKATPRAEVPDASDASGTPTVAPSDPTPARARFGFLRPTPAPEQES